MAWQDHFCLSLCVAPPKLARIMKKSCGVLQRPPAFILFKTTDSTNHAFDWTNLRGSGGGIISLVEWFSLRNTPESRIKTNQEIHRFDFDQSAGAELWIRPISSDETPAVNQDCGINHIITLAGKGHLLVQRAAYFCNGCPRTANTVIKTFIFVRRETEKPRKLAHSTEMIGENITQMMLWQSNTLVLIITVLVLITKLFQALWQSFLVYQ